MLLLLTAAPAVTAWAGTLPAQDAEESRAAVERRRAGGCAAERPRIGDVTGPVGAGTADGRSRVAPVEDRMAAVHFTARCMRRYHTREITPVTAGRDERQAQPGQPGDARHLVHGAAVDIGPGLSVAEWRSLLDESTDDEGA